MVLAECRHTQVSRRVGRLAPVVGRHTPGRRRAVKRVGPDSKGEGESLVLRESGWELPHL